MLKKTWHKFIMFCFIGGLAFLIDVGFFNLFYYFGLSFVFSRYLGISLSMIFNFSMNRNITFSAKHKRVHTQIWKFLILYFFSMSMNVLIGWLILQSVVETTLTANIAAITGILVSIPINFFGLKKWVFI